uniref:Uncharacterized protein n=1 Tax=Geospiza parvula TaxID=87175 RepID=A0A8C3N4U5_GEOPR
CLTKEPHNLFNKPLDVHGPNLHSRKQQPVTLLSSRRRALAYVKVQGQGLAADPVLRRGHSCPTTACPWHLEMATDTQTSTCPPQTPCLCPNSRPSWLYPTPCSKLHSATGQEEVCKGERD